MSALLPDYTASHLKRQQLMFTSVTTSDIVYLVTWTKITWRIVVGKLMRRVEANPYQEVRSCGRVQNVFLYPCLSVPPPLRVTINHPALSYAAIIIIIIITTIIDNINVITHNLFVISKTEKYILVI